LYGHERAGTNAPWLVGGGSAPTRAADVDAAHRLVGVQKLIDPCAQPVVSAAGFVQESGPFVGRAFHRSQEYRSGLVFIHVHGTLTSASPLFTSATRPGEFSHRERKFSQAAMYL
jgi:hypothetical protein